MGNICISSQRKHAIDTMLQQLDIVEHMTKYNLTKSNIIKLYTIFHSSDLNHSNTIDSNELHILFREKYHTVFLAHLLKTMMQPDQTTLSFIDFIRLVTLYAIYTESDIIRFCYSVFDVGCSNNMDQYAFKAWLKQLYDTKTNDIPTSVYTALSQYNSNSSTIGINEFTELHLRYPQFLWPAFRLQFRMQELTLGMTTWSNIKLHNTGLTPAVYGNRPLCGLCICLPRTKLTPQMIVTRYNIAADDIQADASARLQHKNAKLKTYISKHSKRHKRSKSRKQSLTDELILNKHNTMTQNDILTRMNTLSNIHSSIDSHPIKHRTSVLNSSNNSSDSTCASPLIDRSTRLHASKSLHNLQEEVVRKQPATINRTHSMDEPHNNASPLFTSVRHKKTKQLSKSRSNSASIQPLSTIHSTSNIHPSHRIKV